jgi:hypothetical protein
MFGRSQQQLLVVAVVLLALQQRMTGAANGGPGEANSGPGAADGGPGAEEEEKEERLWRDLDQVKLELGEMEKVKSFFLFLFSSSIYLILPVKLIFTSYLDQMSFLCVFIQPSHDLNLILYHSSFRSSF